EEVGPYRREHLLRRVHARLRLPAAAELVLGRLRDRVEMREQIDRAEEERDRAGGEGRADSAQRVAADAEQFEETVRAGKGDDVQRRLLVAGEDQKREGDGQQR